MDGKSTSFLLEPNVTRKWLKSMLQELMGSGSEDPLFNIQFNDSWGLECHVKQPFFIENTTHASFQRWNKSFIYKYALEVSTNLILAFKYF